MAKIYSGTTASTGNIRVTKNLGSVMIQSEGYLNWSTGKISAYLERSGSNNIDIAVDVPILDFMLLNKIGEPFLTTVLENQELNNDGTHDLHFQSLEFDFGVDSGVKIENNDVLVFSISSFFEASKTTNIYSLDDVDFANRLRKHEFKNMLADETSRVFQTNGSEFALIGNNVDKISKIKFMLTNGKTLEMDLNELKHTHYQLTRDLGEHLVHPFIKHSLVADVENVTGNARLSVIMDKIITNELVVCLADVQEFEITRSSSGLIPVHFQYDIAYATSTVSPLIAATRKNAR